MSFLSGMGGKGFILSQRMKKAVEATPWRPEQINPPHHQEKYVGGGGGGGGGDEGVEGKVA